MMGCRDVCCCNERDIAVAMILVRYVSMNRAVMKVVRDALSYVAPWVSALNTGQSCWWQVLVSLLVRTMLTRRASAILQRGIARANKFVKPFG
jgi:hypothetical protein